MRITHTMENHTDPTETANHSVNPEDEKNVVNAIIINW